MDNIIKGFTKGIHNVIEAENIPSDASSDSSNFITKNGKIVLIGGRKEIGASGAVGKITGQHFGYKVDGSKVHYAKFGTIIKYLDAGGVWQNCITGLTENADYSFANYSSLAGAFTFINGIDGYWKIINSHPASPIDVFDDAKNFKGYILIDRGRTLLWNRAKDKTGLYGSRIDRQNATIYNTVSDENVGALGATVYSGTLAFKAGGSKRSCFGVSFVASLEAGGTETFRDDYLGGLKSERGSVGVINYATGAFTITFESTTSTAVLASYQWEDTNINGITDFTFSTPRQASQGFQFPQDEGGDAILNVLIGQDGNYYSLKKQSSYVLSLEASDLTAVNELYRKDIGIPFWKSAVSTSKGIVFINTANPSDPKITILQRDKLGIEIEPFNLFTHFDLTKYDYSDCYLGNYDRWVLVFCKKIGSDSNDTILMCDVSGKTIDVVNYTGRSSVQDAGNLFIGDSITKTVYQIFNGFDDLGLPISNYWISKDETYNSQILKKFRRLRLKGLIDPDQKIEVYVNYDNMGFGLVGTIVGQGDYVNYSDSQAIGGNFIGESQVGGDDIAIAYSFFMEIKMKTPKFRKRTIKLKATGIGYFDLDFMSDWDILTFEARIPKIYRQKQNVSISGLLTNQ